jgi:hypothetical protein
LRQAVCRDYKPLNVPEDILRSLCSGISWCRVSDGHVKATGVPRWEEVLSGAEAVICNVLREHGGTMPLRQLKKLCFVQGVKRENLWRILSFSPLIRRFDREVYGLIGADAPPKTATSARPVSVTH